MEDKKMHDRVHFAVQQHCALSGIKPNPYLTKHVLSIAQKGRKNTLRSKKAWVLLMALVIILLSATIGLAWSLSRDYFADIAKITLTSGDYEHWTLEEKRYMMTVMGKYGLLSETEAHKRSRQSEQEIDEFMLERYAFEDAPDDISKISLTRIAWVEMGPYTDWDNETWVWYSKMMFEVGLWNETSDVDVYETPGEEAITPEKAVQLAEESLIAQGMEREKVEKAWHVWHYMTHASDVKREEMVYCITFRFDDGSETYVFMTPDGEKK